MERIYLLLGVVAALLHGTAFVMYNWQVLTGRSEPKSASWGVWAFLAALNALSFGAIVTNWYTGLQFFVGTAGCIGTFVMAWHHGKLRRPSGSEWLYFVAGVVASAVWWIFHSAEWANMIVIGAVLIAFQPTIATAHANPFADDQRAWWIWTSGFSVTVMNLILQDARPVSFVTPVGLLLAHGTVAWLSRESRRQQFLVQ